VWLAQVVGLEAGDLEIDHGADILELCDELGVPGGREVDLDLTQVCGRSEETTQAAGSDMLDSRGQDACRSPSPDPCSALAF